MQHAITFVIAALCILAIAYRLYGVFFVRKVLHIPTHGDRSITFMPIT